MRFIFQLSLVLFFTGPLAFGGDAFEGGEYLTIGEVEGLYLKHGETKNLTANFVVAPGLHIQANPATRPYLIATELKIKSEGGITFGKVIYPKSTPFSLKTNKEKTETIDTYEGKFALKVAVTATKKAKAGPHYFVGKLKYQACTDKTCFFPRFIEVPIVVHVK